MIVFGGSNMDGDYSETWLLQNASNLTPSWMYLSVVDVFPAPRSSAAMAYDEANDRMIVFGGWSPGAGGAFFDDVWVLEGVTGGMPMLIDLAPAGLRPDARRGATAVYAPASNRLIVFGGELSGGALQRERPGRCRVVDRAQPGRRPIRAQRPHRGVQRGSRSHDRLRRRFADEQLRRRVRVDQRERHQRRRGVARADADRHGHSAVYDEAADRMIIAGGFPTPQGETVMDVFVLDGASGP
jgi:hypothetical protein